MARRAQMIELQQLFEDGLIDMDEHARCRERIMTSFGSGELAGSMGPIVAGIEKIAESFSSGIERLVSSQVLNVWCRSGIERLSMVVPRKVCSVSVHSVHSVSLATHVQKASGPLVG